MCLMEFGGKREEREKRRGGGGWGVGDLIPYVYKKSLGDLKKY